MAEFKADHLSEKENAELIKGFWNKAKPWAMKQLARETCNNSKETCNKDADDAVNASNEVK